MVQLLQHWKQNCQIAIMCLLNKSYDQSEKNCY